MFSLLTLIVTLWSVAGCTAITFPANASTNNCNAEFLSVPGHLDGPKLTCINDTVLDLWYFDAISPDQKSSVVISFYLSTADAFPFLTDPTDVVPNVGISASYPNGTAVGFEYAAHQATITSDSDTSCGSYTGADFGTGSASWTSVVSYGITTYSVEIDAPDVGIQGSLVLSSVAPPHYPCTAHVKTAGQTEEVAPNLGWSNILPAATASVDLSILGSPLKFNGIGYHDKNWSDKPFLDSVGSWYWGHTTLGQYSLVWFDFLTPAGVEYVSSYVSHEGTVIASSCDAGAITVRPTGQNDTYPPTTTSGTPSGFSISVDMGTNGTMMVNVEGIIVGQGGGLYRRGLGYSYGNINGTELTNGTVMWDAFSLESS